MPDTDSSRNAAISPVACTSARTATSGAAILPECVLAIDIGGTKVQAALVDRGGTVGDVRRLSTPQGVSGQQLLVELLELVASLRGGFAAIGVACPGPMSRNGELVSPLNIPAWREFPLAAQLEAELGVPVTVANDAVAMTLGEHWLGALRGRTTGICMVVSTGVGAGVIADGRLLDGASGNAGHIGHVIVTPNGRRCACGARGCLEAEVSGPALQARSGGHPPPFPEEVLRAAGTAIGRALASAAALLDLEIAVIAGGVGLRAGDALLAEVRAEVARSFQIFHRTLPVVRATTHPLVGAAARAMFGCERDGVGQGRVRIDSRM